MMRNIQTREGFEFWDKLNALPRYAFLLSPSGKSVQKFEDQAMGNWIDVHEAQKVVDQAEERINDRQDELREVNRQLEQFRERCHGIKNLSAIESRDDQLAAAREKIAALQLRLNAADQRIDELSQDKARLDALESNCWDVRFDSSPNGDAGDSSINIEVLGHWMDKPFERVIGENYSENLRAAIDQAMTAPAYPPARPEYPEIDEAFAAASIS
ncbi:hypothetical protein [Pseudomonas fragi]|uniref:hypothetical protein n=1 Tax=Pseudomonas fragi TaxID=296 RepID=UPI0020CE1657|nr:hypothetical protein [Pseudomonas fragi]